MRRLGTAAPSRLPAQTISTRAPHSALTSPIATSHIAQSSSRKTISSQGTTTPIHTNLVRFKISLHVLKWQLCHTWLHSIVMHLHKQCYQSLSFYLFLLQCINFTRIYRPPWYHVWMNVSHVCWQSTWSTKPTQTQFLFTWVFNLPAWNTNLKKFSLPAVVWLYLFKSWHLFSNAVSQILFVLFVLQFIFSYTVSQCFLLLI